MADRRTGYGRPGKLSGGNGGHGVASLVGGGPSIVGPGGAMRSRDVSRPRDEDWARAEQTVVVRRRVVDLPPLPPLASPSDVHVHALPSEGHVGEQSSGGESEPADS